MFHETHCCIIHGCKYGENDACPVYLAKVKQKFLCQICFDFVYNEIKTTSELHKEINKKFLKRNRLYKLNQISKNNDDIRNI